MLFPLTYALLRYVSKTGDNWYAKYALEKLEGYTLPNWYVWIYATQLNNTFLIMINFDHILTQGFIKILSEDRISKNVSNIVTVLLLLVIPAQVIGEAVIFYLKPQVPPKRDVAQVWAINEKLLIDIANLKVETD